MSLTGRQWTRRGFARALGGMSLAAAGCSRQQAAPEADPPARGPEFHRGVNFTAEWPDKYRSRRAFRILESLPDYGVDSVALVPYGFCRRDDPVIRFGGPRVWERDGDIERLAEHAHRLGMRVFLKPQLWVPRAHPGAIDFDDERDRDVWFRGYEAFLRHYASLAERIAAELFCVGVEYSRMARYEDAWRRLIAVAREIYSGSLIYAANWGEEFETLAFWDALDYIGLNNYYPLPDDLSMDGVVDTVRRVHEKHNRPVIFPEAGYASLVNPHREPWAEEPREISLEDQARCYEALLAAFYPQPWCHGIYWWKVGTNGFGGPEDGSHTPWRKPAMEVVARWYRRRRAA